MNSNVHKREKDTDNPPYVDCANQFVCIFWELIDTLGNQCSELSIVDVSKSVWIRRI